MKSFFSFRRTNAILMKEFIQLSRDKVTLQMIVLIPIIQLLIFGYALNTDPKHLPTAVLSQDNSTIARAFVTGLQNSGYFDVRYHVQSREEAETLIQQGKIVFIVTIPANFQRHMIRKEHPAILLEADATDPQASSGAVAAAENVLKRIIQRHPIEGTLSYLKTVPAAITLITQKRYNPEGFTRYNIVPGLIAVILTMTGIMMTALAITRERERGTMENLLAMPARPLEVMAGKIIPYVIIGFIQAAIIIAASKTLFDIPIIGSLWLLTLALLIFITCNMAMGFTLSAATENQTQALQLSITITLPSIMLSGFMFPFLGMPLWAQIIGKLLPATHFINLSRAILLKGSTFTEIWPHFWPLLVFMVFITLIAMKRYRQTLD